MDSSGSKARKEKLFVLSGKRKLCPMLQDPSPECYCLDLNSQSIEAAIVYCSGDFEGCSIYRKRKAILKG